MRRLQASGTPSYWIQDTGRVLGTGQESWSPTSRKQLELVERKERIREMGSWADVPASRIAVVATLPRVAKHITADPRPHRPPRRCEALPGVDAIRREAHRERGDSRGRAEGVEHCPGDVAADLQRLRAGNFAAREHLSKNQDQELRRWILEALSGMKVLGSGLQPSFDKEPRMRDLGLLMNVQCTGTRTHQCDALDSGLGQVSRLKIRN